MGPSRRRRGIPLKGEVVRRTLGGQGRAMNQDGNQEPRALGAAKAMIERVSQGTHVLKENRGRWLEGCAPGGGLRPDGLPNETGYGGERAN